MFDYLNWVLGVIGTLVGMAGAVVFGACVLLMFFLVKKLPAGWRRVLSALAAYAFILTVFREITAQNLFIYADKTVILADFLLKMQDVTLLINLFIVVIGEGIFRRAEKTACEELPFKDFDEGYIANENTIFAPSLVLKASSVILQ